MTLAVESMADVDSLSQSRRRGRDEEQDTSHEGHDQHDSGEPTHSRSDSVKKRKRTRKGDSEKKFDCKHEGCGKSYSRAEHLYRHQLNRKLLFFPILNILFDYCFFFLDFLFEL